MIKIKKYRNEWKYNLSNGELTLLKSRIEKVMSLDSHTDKDGKYIIHSLYFDDYKDRALYNTEAGLAKRFKWRIRYYNSNLDYISLEKKEKLNSKCHKKSCPLTLEEYNLIVNGDIYDLLYKTDKELIKELIKDMMIYDYKPKLIIDYERIAYVEEITNVRVTFDMKISTSYDIDSFLDGNYSKFYLQSNGYNVLEVKFDDILPSYIKKIIESYRFNQTSFSKYYYSRRMLGNYMI